VPLTRSWWRPRISSYATPSFPRLKPSTVHGKAVNSCDCKPRARKGPAYPDRAQAAEPACLLVHCAGFSTGVPARSLRRLVDRCACSFIAQAAGPVCLLTQSAGGLLARLPTRSLSGRIGFPIHSELRLAGSPAQQSKGR